MFNVMALDRPGDTSWVKIGEMYNETTFTKSLYGDERLFFQHGGANLDLDWWEAHDPNYDRRATMRPLTSQFLRNAPAWFDRNGNNKFLEWKTWFDVPIPENDDVIKEGAAGGCPFKWVLDYITEVDPDFPIK